MLIQGWLEQVLCANWNFEDNSDFSRGPGMKFVFILVFISRWFFSVVFFS